MHLGGSAGCSLARTSIATQVCRSDTEIETFGAKWREALTAVATDAAEHPLQQLRCIRVNREHLWNASNVQRSRLKSRHWLYLRLTGRVATVENPASGFISTTSTRNPRTTTRRTSPSCVSIATTILR
jgi:hypothetical protein